MDLREVLHWLVDQHTVPAYARAGGPTADEVREAIDAHFGTGVSETVPDAEPAAEPADAV